MNIVKEEFLQVFTDEIRPSYEDAFARIQRNDTRILYVICCIALLLFVLAFLAIPVVSSFNFPFSDTLFSCMGWGMAIFLVILALSEVVLRVRWNGSFLAFFNPRTKMKQTIYQTCAQLVMPEFTYSYRGGMTRKDFIQYGVIHPRYVHYFTSQDGLTGNWNGKHTRISEVKVKRLVKNPVSAEGEINILTPFSGIAVEMQTLLNADFSFVALADKEYYQSSDYTFLGTRRKDPLKPVSFGNEAFHEQFRCFTNDEDLSRALFDNETIQKILRVFTQESPSWFHFAIANGRFVFLFDHPPIFELFQEGRLSGGKIWSDFERIHRLLNAMRAIELDTTIF